MAAFKSYDVGEVMEILPRAWPFRHVTREDVKALLGMLAGDYEHRRGTPPAAHEGSSRRESPFPGSCPSAPPSRKESLPLPRKSGSPSPYPWWRGTATAGCWLSPAGAPFLIRGSMPCGRRRAQRWERRTRSSSMRPRKETGLFSAPSHGR